VAVEVDVSAGERGDPLDFATGDQLSFRLELVENALDVDGVPDDDRVADDREAERLLGLLLGGPLLDVPFVGVEDGAAQGVELLALVELPTDPLAELLVGQPGEDEVRLDQPPVFCGVSEFVIERPTFSTTR
jgi:hypothetical protein